MYHGNESIDLVIICYVSEERHAENPAIAALFKELPFDSLEDDGMKEVHGHHTESEKPKLFFSEARETLLKFVLLIVIILSILALLIRTMYNHLSQM